MKQLFQFRRLAAAMTESVEARNNAVGDLREGCANGTYRLGQDGLEIPRLFEAMTGYTAQQYLQHQSTVEAALRESASGVTMSDFKLVTAGLILREIKDAPEQAQLIADKLYRVENSVPRQNSQAVPMIAGPTRWERRKLKELEPYPPIGVRNGFVSYQRQEKSGGVVPLSKESLLADTAAVIIRTARNAADGGLITRNIEMLEVALGTTGKWRFGLNDDTFTAYNPYNTSATGAAVKNVLASNPLDSWESIDKALQVFRDMKLPVTGEFCQIPLKLQMLVPWCVFMKANVIKNAVSTSTYNAAAASATIRFDGPNPLNYVIPGMTIEILASQYVDEITGATISSYPWWIGDFTEALVNDQVYGPTYEELSKGSESSFWKDMDLAIKLGWYEAYVWYNNLQVVKCTSGA